jgi:Reverse transcriptase (RNA-dependent DNA polymerase)
MPANKAVFSGRQRRRLFSFAVQGAEADLPRLRAAAGQHIPCFGELQSTVSFGDKCFKWTFLLADVEAPLLGADFLRSHRLLVDLHGGCLIEAASMQRFGDNVQSSHTPPQLCSVLQATPPRLHLLISQLLNVLNATGVLPPVKHTVEHFIETTGRLVLAKFWRLDPEKLQAAKAEFLKMEKERVIQRSSSPLSSPLHMVLKKDDTWRPCGDYRRLNDVTVLDKNPVPNIQDMSAKLAGCSVFTKLDLKKGYYQIPVAAAYVPKTAVTTPFGMFEFLRMPFGLKNAGQSFQRLMDTVTADLVAAFTYLDDVIITSSPEEHEATIQLVLERVSARGVEPLEDHVAAIRDFKPPADRQQLQRFLGMVNFYRRFLPGAAGVLQPLTDALQ